MNLKYMKRVVRWSTLGVLATALVSSAAPSLEDRLILLEAEVEDLRNRPQVASAPSSTTVGGYGELHYNNLSGKNGGSDKDSVDFHRFVLFFGHEFTDRIRLVSELELEHALSGDGESGEVELEQAYVEFDLTDNHRIQAGVFLLPVGLLNANHEPPRFYGVERNPVEKNILPTTWWEAGVGISGELRAGWRYAAAYHSGLSTSTGSTYSVRSGRQKVSKATANDGAATVALTWGGAGVSVGGALQYQADITQGNDASAGSAWLGEVHTDLRKGPFQLRGLYASWLLDGSGPEMMDADEQYGWYIEPSIRPVENVGVFVRYNVWDNRAGSSDSTSEKQQWDAGINWWPHEQVVLKADYQWQDNEGGKEQNGFNLGVGYEF